MATTIKVQITPSGAGLPDPGYSYRYQTLNLFESGYPNKNLVSNDNVVQVDVFSGGNAISALVAFSGSTWITDSTRYMIIQAAAGHEHNGVWDTNKAYCYNTAERTIAIHKMYANISKMQLRTHSSSSTQGCVSLTAQGASVTYNVDRCIILDTGSASSSQALSTGNPYDGNLAVTNLTNCIVMSYNGTTCVYCVVNSLVTLYNCTIAGYRCISNNNPTYTTINTQNCYLYAIVAGGCYVNGVNQGSKDATSNAQATDPNLRNIPYSTATFFNVTQGSENLRLVVSASNKLIDNGANLTSSGVIADIIGTARPQSGAFDIGAFENDIPICWNYTARYRSSNKLFKASGCGVFPKTLRVPENVDRSTGRMVDDGISINPDEYEVI